ncbi:MAG: hypothetical protein ACOX9E_05985 [Lentisphaeria bacterium]
MGRRFDQADQADQANTLHLTIFSWRFVPQQNSLLPSRHFVAAKRRKR